MCCRGKPVTIKGALASVLQNDFAHVSLLSLQWLVFGSAGFLDRPTHGNLASFNKCTGHLAAAMKPLARAHTLHRLGVMKKFGIHSAMLDVGAQACLGDGSPLPGRFITNTFTNSTTVSCKDCDALSQALTYFGWLSKQERTLHRNITDDHKIILMHYTVRAQRPFVERKLRTAAGSYGYEFRRIIADLREKDNVESIAMQKAFARFESKHELDGNATICEVGVEAAQQLGNIVRLL